MIHLIGGGGFIGRHIQKLSANLPISVWSHNSIYDHKLFNLSNPNTWNQLINEMPQRAVLLSWPGLPNYDHSHHLTTNLPNSFTLVKRLAESGLKELVVAGTCYEYGIQNGCLYPDILTSPCTLYGIAKDALCKSLQLLCKSYDMRLCWARIFYPYGEDQSSQSLMPSLINAARRNETTFQLSSPGLIRDFVSVEDVAYQLIQLLQSKSAYGIFNCASGKPTSIKTFAEEIIKKFNLDITLIYSHLQKRHTEPVEFWANMDKWDHFNLTTKKDYGGHGSY
jgi:dTDP-6-deoxy-L-talose 4-dehydrogenase (NAD+)